MKNIMIVHGFIFDEPNIDSLNSANLDFRPQIETLVGQPVELYQWYSAPFGLNAPRETFYSIYNTIKVWVRSWYEGYADPYSWCYNELVRHAQPGLTKAINDNYARTGEKLILIGHSLGTRMVLETATQSMNCIDKIILLNGAELVENVMPFLPSITCPVLNIAVKNDGVLADLGSKFSGDGTGACIGHIGLEDKAPVNWTDIIIDDDVAITIAKARGWDIEGDDGSDFIDSLTRNHWYSYRNLNNAPLIRAFINGDTLSDFKR